LTLPCAPYPGLAPAAFTAAFPAGLIAKAGPDWLKAGLAIDAEAPFERTEEIRAAVRDLLRARGYKPTGRGKPASEYLVRASTEGELSSINAAVDACNVVSLHSGLPISVIDLDRSVGDLRIDVGSPGDRYVFNAGGQEIDVAGLPCLFDADGPCANAVRDSHRTKTRDETTRTLSVIWAPAGLASRRDEALEWYREILEQLGASTAEVGISGRS
jgi:DNA/RNA-binding domain of Phe-tRNA-synthetase-like protein